MNRVKVKSAKTFGTTLFYCSWGTNRSRYNKHVEIDWCLYYL